MSARARPGMSLPPEELTLTAARNARILLDHGFTAPGVAVLTEQDMLGDRLIRRTKRKKSADAFLAELATLSPGDLVVHTDHGIGRYIGLTSIPVGQSPHDCVALEYAGGDKLYVPVENIDVLSRYGSGEEGAALDRLFNTFFRIPIFAAQFQRVRAGQVGQCVVGGGRSISFREDERCSQGHSDT